MNRLPSEVAELKAELERLASERRWEEIRKRTASLDDAALMADPKLAFQVAQALVHLGRMARALNLVLAAEAAFRARHDALNLMAALNLAGAVQFELGDLNSAEERFSDLLELAGERGDDEMSGRATNNLGALFTLRGEFERALSLYHLSIPAYQKVGFLVGLAQTAHNLGIVYRDLGYWRESEHQYRHALKRARQLDDDRLAAMARAGRAEISHLRGDQVYAIAEAGHALEAFAKIGDELGRAEALRLLGSIALAQAEWKTAARHLNRALKLSREHSNPLLEAEILEERSVLHSNTDRPALAHADLEVAAAIYRRLGATKRFERVDERLGRLTP